MTFDLHLAHLQLAINGRIKRADMTRRRLTFSSLKYAVNVQITTRSTVDYTSVNELQCIYFVTNDEHDDRYGSVNVAENDSSTSSCFAGVKLSAVITLQTEW